MSLIKVLLDDVSGFDWDAGNRDKSKKKHEVDWWECEEVLFNKPLIINYDEKHSTKKEKRFQVLGKTNWERKLFLSFTIRNSMVRVISARDQNKKERYKYEKAK